MPIRISTRSLGWKGGIDDGGWGIFLIFWIKHKKVEPVLDVTLHFSLLQYLEKLKTFKKYFSLKIFFFSKSSVLFFSLLFPWYEEFSGAQ